MNALKGAIIAVVSSLFVAILFAYTFRLPIPMAGMLGPLGDLNPYGESVFGIVQSVIIAWLFYGAFGGFVVVAIFGAIAGFVAGRKNANLRNKNSRIVLWSVIASCIPVFFLSTLDYMVGPW